MGVEPYGEDLKSRDDKKNPKREAHRLERQVMSAVWRAELITTLPEDTLIARTLEGDEEAFEEVLRRYNRPIYSFIVNYVGDYDVAQDAFQEAFVRAYKNLRKYRLGTNFSAWLHKVALNASKDCLKKRYRNQKMEVHEAEDFDPMAVLRDSGPSPEEILERRELQAVVRKALSSLSSPHREVILLYQFQGFSYEEISSLLSCPLGTVKSRIHYAMRKLEELLRPLARELRLG
jgi:RNA polymerase sigma-70 factor (ECF subfamily)